MFFKAHKNQTVCYRNNIRSFQKKKHRADWFRGGKILQGNTRRKNILHWKNNLSWRIMLEKHLKPLYVEKKNSISTVLEKRSYPNRIPPLPPPKVKRSAPCFLHLNHAFRKETFQRLAHNFFQEFVQLFDTQACTELLLVQKWHAFSCIKTYLGSAQ